MIEFIEWLLPDLSAIAWASHSAIFIINISLILLAEPMVRLIDNGKENTSKVKIFKALNVLVLILHVIDLAFLRFSSHYQDYFIKAGLSLMSAYIGLLAYNFASYFSHKRFGREKLLDDKTIFLETYSTRIVDLISLVLITFTVIYSLIKIWGADSLLETTGIFGILAAFLAFTSNIWGPDIISGLIILNSQILEDGDVVVVDGYPDEYIINKVTFIYIILYDVRNNHRTLIRNSRFIQSKIDNLSRVASTDGIRKHIVYKIGYAAQDSEDPTVRSENMQNLLAKVDKMFDKANRSCIDHSEIKINKNKNFEWALTQTGDYALEFTLWFYLERIPNTKVTSTIRKHLMGTIYKINQAVYVASVAEGVSLATPQLNNIVIEKPA